MIFTINKSGMSLLEIEEKFQFSHVVPVKLSKNPATFEAGYKEPEFKVGDDGHLQGGDLEAMKVFNAKFASRQEDTQSALTETSVSISETPNVSSTSFETDPTCCQC